MKYETKESLALIISIIIAVAAVLVLIMGCNGNSANVKPSNALKTSLKNQQRMEEKIDHVGGDLIKVQQTVTEVENTVTQTFETIQGSTQTGDVEGDVSTSHDTNSIWYGLGLVVIVLIFALILIWGMARMMKGLIGKVFNRR